MESTELVWFGVFLRLVAGEGGASTVKFPEFSILSHLTYSCCTFIVVGHCNGPKIPDGSDFVVCFNPLVSHTSNCSYPLL